MNLSQILHRLHKNRPKVLVNSMLPWLIWNRLLKKNAAVAEQSAAASHNLAAMSDELANLVAQFHIETNYPALTGISGALSFS